MAKAKAQVPEELASALSKLGEKERAALMAALGVDTTTAPADPNGSAPATVKTEMRKGKDGQIELVIPSIAGRNLVSFPLSSSGKSHNISNGRFVPPTFGAIKGPDGQIYHVVVSWNVYAQPGAKEEG